MRWLLLILGILILYGLSRLLRKLLLIWRFERDLAYYARDAGLQKSILRAVLKQEQQQDEHAYAVALDDKDEIPGKGGSEG